MTTPYHPEGETAQSLVELLLQDHGAVFECAPEFWAWEYRAAGDDFGWVRLTKEALLGRVAGLALARLWNHEEIMALSGRGGVLEIIAKRVVACGLEDFETTAIRAAWHKWWTDTPVSASPIEPPALP